ncbi:MAG TPA: hypothetical protein VH764_03535 [Gemmatimonadales bacterium]
MRTKPLLAAALLASCTGSTEPPEGTLSRRVESKPTGYVAKTVVTRDGRRFRINGAVTYRGKPAEGLLMNVRMVNAIFEDTNRPEFDPAANTDEFVARMPEYVSQGVLAFTISLQGGYPGYEGARNTAFLADGRLDAAYLARAADVIERADALGAVIILTLYYQRQDQYLQNEQAVRAGIVNVVDWVRARGYRNVILELVNEYNHRGFQHAVLRSDASVAGLIGLAKQRYPALLVSASHVRNGRTSTKVADASDLILVHFNQQSPAAMADSVRVMRAAYPGKPIVCNEDAKTGATAAAATSSNVKAGASYGLTLERKNQDYPFTFNGRADDPVAYDRIAALTR